VTWAYTDDYVGWAPVPPTFALSATGYFGAPVVVTATRYVFVPTRQFVGVPVATVRVPAQQGVTILPHAEAGPSARQVAQSLPGASPWLNATTR